MRASKVAALTRPEIEKDENADRLFVSISDAVMAAVARSGLDPMNAEHQRSILRAAGATMALLASAARLAGITDEDAAAIVCNGFESKFEVGLPLTKDVPS